MKNLLRNIIVLPTVLLILSQPSLAESFPLKLFQAERDQPTLQKLFRWDNRIIAQAGELFFEIDPTNGTATLIHFAGSRSMHSLTTALGKPFALGGYDFRQDLFYRSGKNDWDWIRVPQEEGKEDRYFRIVGDEKRLLFLGQKSLKIFDGKKWYYQAYYNQPKFRFRNSDACVLWSGNVYYGMDRGEFGGGFYKLDLFTGVWVEVAGTLPKYSTAPGELAYGSDMLLRNVTDICLTPDGNMKIICGCSHMGFFYGQIVRNSGDGLESELLIHRSITNKNWAYKAASFEAIQFNKNGEQILLTSNLGLLAYRSNKWVRLTPQWNDHVYLTSFLILNDEQYLIGTFDAGLVVVDLKKKTEKVIQLATSFTGWEEKQIEPVK